MPKLDTRMIHAGEPEPKIRGAVVMPIFQSSTYEMDADAGYHDIRYLRLSNSPTHEALHSKLASLEDGEAAVATASGMAAISTAMLAVLKTGDHVIAQRCLYGGTHALVTHDLPALGIETTFVDGDAPDTWAAAVRPTTKVFYCEALTNPTLEVADLGAIVAFARARGLISMIDATFASPVNFRPLPFGFDLVVHSATKYLNGHSDLVAGAVIGRRALIDQVKHKLDHLGGTLDPHACFLLHRGIKTLGVRVRHQNASALALAQFLERHPAVARVHHAGLASHPQHARARELFTGFGAMLAFEAKGGEAAALALVKALEIATDAPSLGGPETLVTLPSRTSHVGLDPRERRAMGVSDGLVRVSVGLEDVDDLRDDFAQALARIG